MFAGVEIFIDGDEARLTPLEPGVRGRLVTALLGAAKATGDTVRPDSGGRIRAYRVTAATAEAAGVIGYRPSNDPPESTPMVFTEAPPRTGKGSSRAAWHEFLTAHTNIDVPELGATRDQLIALWDTQEQ